jgi:hypothetical protein
VSKNLFMPGPQTKSRPDGWLEQSLKIWWRLLELGRDGVKPGVEAGANALDRTNDHNRNAGGDQAIFNRGGA